MDKDEYGVKLSIDLTDFNKGVNEVKKKIKGIEDETKVKINNPFEQMNVNFKDKFKNMNVDELNKSLEKARSNLSKLQEKAFKIEYLDPVTKSSFEMISQGTIEDMNKYKEALEEVMEIEDELQKYETPLDKELLAEARKEAELFSLNLTELRQKMLNLLLEKKSLMNQEFVSDEDRQKIENLNIELEKISSVIKSMGGTPLKIIEPSEIEETNEDLEETNEQLEKIPKNLDKISGKSGTTGNDLSNPFKKATKSLKRFALSLFGIQSIWRLFSRASSTYLSNNIDLANKIKSAWNGLGTLVSPIVEFLANLFLKLLGYINVVTKALFNFDFITKANEATLKSYQKQVSKTSKALAVIDELTNINQQNGTEDNEPKGLIEIPELNPKIVKFLESLSAKLKPIVDAIGSIVDFCLKNPEVLLGLLGAVAVGKAIKSILGIAGITGGSGLLGLASTLGWIAGLGIIAVTIKVAYDIWNADNDYIKGSQELSNQHSKGTKSLIKLSQQGYKKGSREQNTFIAHLKDEISTNAQIIKDNQDKLTSYNLVDGTIAQITGKYQQQTKAIEDAENEIDTLIGLFKDQYEMGNLTADQEEYYLQLLDIKNEKIKKTGQVYSVTTQNYEGLTEQNINNTLKFSDQVTNLGNNIKNVGITAMQETKTAKTEVDNMVTTISNKLKNPFTILFKKEEIVELPQNVQNMVNTIAEKLKNPFTIVFKSKVEKPDLTEVQNIINGVFGKLGVKAENGWVSAFGVRLFKIPGFAIGTDLVKSDGLAYLHAGEKVVPADAVKGGYTGGNNEKTNDLLRELIYAVESKDFNATISSDDVGRASVNYIRNQNRIMGGSVI